MTSNGALTPAGKPAELTEPQLHAVEQGPAAAARTFSQTAHAAAAAWARQPLRPPEQAHAARAVYSAIRDVGISVRVLARQTVPAVAGQPDPANRARAAARLLLQARIELEPVAARGQSLGGECGGPAAAMRTAARATLAAWRHPPVNQQHWNETAAQFAEAIVALAAAVQSLTTRATPLQREALRGTYSCLSVAADCLRAHPGQAPGASARHLAPGSQEAADE